LRLLRLGALLFVDQDLERPEAVLEEQRHSLVVRDEWVINEVEVAILQELAEVDAQTPRVRPVRLQPLEEDSLDLLLHTGLRIYKQRVKEQAAAVSVRIRIPQFVHDAVKEPQTHWRWQSAHDLLKHVILVLVLRPSVLQVLLSDVQYHRIDHRAAGLVGNVLIL